jgi:hypothetical protein
MRSCGFADELDRESVGTGVALKLFRAGHVKCCACETAASCIRCAFTDQAVYKNVVWLEFCAYTDNNFASPLKK